MLTYLFNVPEQIKLL